MDLFSQNEILLMIGVVGVLLVSILILALLDLRDRVKNKKSEAVVDESVEFGEKMETVEVAEPKPDEMIEVLELEDEVMISDMDIPSLEETVNNDILIEEDEEIVPSVSMVEENQVKVDLDAELNKALETIPNAEDAITNFEMEQERTAIISLDELMQKSNDLYNDNEISQYDDGNEPISIDEIMNRFGTSEEKSVPEVMQNIVEDQKTNITENSMSFENTATYEKLSRSTKNEFMAKLREVNENK